ncbi:MAG TPA: alpha/beta fold hydrolase [Terriglobales bacterium]|jgi:triacylglycerol lipase|nr:alpha/beta fold hydrolase [Terriglobales bacterium]
MSSQLKKRKRKSVRSNGVKPDRRIRNHQAAADIPIWKEALFGAELLLLHASPVFYGLGVQRGDKSAVVLIPGFLGSDLYVTHLQAWLERIGYLAFFSGIGVNAECPNLLIKYRLAATIDKAVAETGRRVHLIGHSLGGIIARSVAAQRPRDIASIITLGSPLAGTVMHPSVLRAADAIRTQILHQHGSDVLPDCYTPRCTCSFLGSLRCSTPRSILQTAIYTKDDGIVDWRYCRTGNPKNDFEVPGTHVGLVFNPSAYSIIAERLSVAKDRQTFSRNS